MSFRKQLPKNPAPTIREMVKEYGDLWALYMAGPMAQAVWMGDRLRSDYHDFFVMKQCEEGKRDRIPNVDLCWEDEREPVHVEHVFPPIPERCWDYRAYRDPDPGNPVGYGGTTFLAINDLIEKESE